MKPDGGHEPIFILDSREKFEPVGVESVEAVEARIVKADGGDGGLVSLSALPGDGGRMNLPPRPETYEADAERRFGNVGYRRVMESGGFTWVQYWLWYLYNPKRVVVTGEHEGDWEFVQVGYAGDKPFCMGASQHHSGEGRLWWDVERRKGRPAVYVALGSHANYFERKDQLPEVGDDADGKGTTLDAIEWRDFGEWATWPGRWGNSTGEGRSPQSPGSQGDRWSAPHRYQTKSMG